MRKLLIAVLAPPLALLIFVYVSRAISNYHWTRTHRPTAAENPEFARTYFGADVRILQFYAREGTVTEGDRTVLCYGVVNAKAVRLEPPIDNVYPAVNRCIDAAPGRQTQYTLTAEGPDGRTVSEIGRA